MCAAVPGRRSDQHAVEAGCIGALETSPPPEELHSWVCMASMHQRPATCACPRIVATERSTLRPHRAAVYDPGASANSGGSPPVGWMLSGAAATCPVASGASHSRLPPRHVEPVNAGSTCRSTDLDGTAPAAESSPSGADAGCELVDDAAPAVASPAVCGTAAAAAGAAVAAAEASLRRRGRSCGRRSSGGTWAQRAAATSGRPSRREDCACMREAIARGASMSSAPTVWGGAAALASAGVAMLEWAAASGVLRSLVTGGGCEEAERGAWMERAADSRRSCWKSGRAALGGASAGAAASEGCNVAISGFSGSCGLRAVLHGELERWRAVVGVLMWQNEGNRDERRPQGTDRNGAD